MCSLAHAVAAALHAGGQGAIVGVASRGLLLLNLLLVRLNLALLVPSPEPANQAATGGANGGALSGITGDCTDHETGHGAAPSALQHATLRRLLWRLRLLRHGIEPGLLDRPTVALTKVAILLILALLLCGIEVEFLGNRGPRSGDERRGDDCRNESMSHCAPSIEIFGLPDSARLSDTC